MKRRKRIVRIVLLYGFIMLLSILYSTIVVFIGLFSTTSYHDDVTGGTLLSLPKLYNNRKLFSTTRNEKEASTNALEIRTGVA